MDHINYFNSELLKEGDIFMSDLYKENSQRVYLLIEKDLDEVFNIIYYTLLSDKGQTLLVNSNYINIKKDIVKIND